MQFIYVTVSCFCYAHDNEMKQNPEKRGNEGNPQICLAHQRSGCLRRGRLPVKISSGAMRYNVEIFSLSLSLSLSLALSLSLSLSLSPSLSLSFSLSLTPYYSLTHSLAPRQLCAWRCARAVQGFEFSKDLLAKRLFYAPCLPRPYPAETIF